MKIPALFFAICFVACSYAETSGTGSGIPNLEDALKADASPSAAPITEPKNKSTPGELKATRDIGGSNSAPVVSAPAPKPANPTPLLSSLGAGPESAISGQQMPSSLKFDQVPLETVVRILSARMGLPIAVEANPAFLITGDYGNMDLRDALKAVAKQAGLAVVAVPPKGLALTDNPLAKNVSVTVGDGRVSSVAYLKRDERSDRDLLKAADQKRAELLKSREALIQQDEDNRTQL